MHAMAIFFIAGTRKIYRKTLYFYQLFEGLCTLTFEVHIQILNTGILSYSYLNGNTSLSWQIYRLSHFHPQSSRNLVLQTDQT